MPYICGTKYMPYICGRRPRDLLSREDYMRMKKKNLLVSLDLCSRSVSAIPDKSLRVLLIEDNPSDVLLSRCHLEPLCKSLRVVSSFSDAINFLEENYVDVIITDIHIIDEVASVSILKSIAEKSADSAILIFSGSEDSELVTGLLRTYAHGYLPKSSDTYRILYQKILVLKERKNKEDNLRTLAYFDQLTGLANRTALLRHMSLLVEDNSPFSIFFCDLNKFKAVNDEWGHDVGDDLLFEVADRLCAAVREEDFVCRYGGDEFIVLVSGSISEDYALSVRERIHAAMNPSFNIGGEDHCMSVSIGSASYPTQAATVDALLRKSDFEMYKKKGSDH